tara:strand:+ start:87 stop:257 length:171 start_codon:yes stop_codon:yes gene_type:complete
MGFLTKEIQMRYMCAECGAEIERPQEMSEPKKFIFDNLFVSEAEVECPKCAGAEDE